MRKTWPKENGQGAIFLAGLRKAVSDRLRDSTLLNRRHYFGEKEFGREDCREKASRGHDGSERVPNVVQNESRLEGQGGEKGKRSGCRK